MHTVPAVPQSERHPDPAWRGRVALTLLGLVLLWPMIVASEFHPTILFDAQSLQATWRFLAAFLPPAHSAEFLQMLLTETWKTVAIATSGLALAMLGAVPATLIVTERLSISRLGTGRMGAWQRLCDGSSGGRRRLARQAAAI